MKRTLQILIVEDDPADAELLLRALRQAGFEPEWRRVDCEEDFRAALHPDLQVILSDYQMPQFTGLRALELAKELCPDVPFLIVSGTIGEETAVEAMRRGAADYLLKDRLGRLGLAVNQALETGRLRRERSWAELQLRLQGTALETAACAVVITDAQGVIQWVNPAFTRQSGYGASEAVGQTPRLLKSGRHDREFYRKLWATILTGGTWRGCFTNRRKDGSLYYDEHTITPVRAPDGKVTHFVAIMNDVTERHLAEEALRESEEKFRRMVEEAPEAIFNLAPDQTITALNPAFETITGHARADWIGRPFHPLVEPESLPMALEIFRRCMGGERSKPFELRMRRRSGDLVDVELVVAPLYKGQQVVGVTGMGRNIMARKLAEAALRESEERFRQLAENINEVFWMTDVEKRRMLYVSPAYERIWGRKREELHASPRTWMEAIVPEDRERIELAATTRQAAGDYLEEYRIRRPDGSVRWIRDRAFPIKDAEGRVYRVVGVAEDITERKQLEEQFLRAQRMEAIGTLAGGVAHDLNNILAPVLMMMGILKMKLTEPGDRQLIDLVESSVQRGAGIINQLLLFSRQKPGESSPVDLRHLLREMTALMREIFPRNITIVEPQSGRLPLVRGDVTQLHQVLMNLCVNARDAMPAGGTLTLSAQEITLEDTRTFPHPDARPGRYVVIGVKDTGHGIPKEILGRIFDPFFTTKEPGKGTGLGLSTVAGIVRRHDGFITVYSEEGLGSLFKVYLPAAQPEAKPDEPGAAAAPVRGHGETVLVVDDESSIVVAEQYVLEQNGYQVLTATGGREAVHCFLNNQDRIRLVVTDLMMPGMDGMALARSLRAISPTLPIIATTGLDREEQRDALAALGITEVLTKPCVPPVLLAAVQRSLAR